MKSQDIVILLKLVSLQEQGQEQGVGRFRLEAQGDDPYSVRNLEASLGISKTEVNESIRRSLASGIAGKDRELGRPSAGNYIYVWPHASGREMGVNRAVVQKLPEAVQKDNRLSP
ncbi:hypothetical protein [Neorhizobium galegae]|uniref:hypothetical protein n=1 Tax=Neorhizobium galegae TaxID=399 RepID=UPI0006224848|nr:hypothetical protein [Neorhizobium galegae]CDZ61907.1 Hypothetical protein NGAL_HAMBI2566_47690 [Neorhizobium galegae bv. orientalis]KAB1122172.1 hypothetical protein F4V90_23675 [Neorhizobium galegae]MCQ1574921.1 hypothetical protein [Neorhizobium galegae]MCQ1810624.1 hypothetical protein [Neorhizobium galegae]MCQ1839039.1 hypothetical protein [Neorhizobium galegae]